jgi:hypothetical protein
VAHAISTVEATKAAKQLIGAYAFLKTHDPDGFAMSIAAVLSQYPAGLVQECIDPRRGAARKIKFLSVAELVQWLDERLAYHQVLAQHRPRLPEPPPKTYTEEHRGTMIGRFAALMASLMTGRQDPVERVRREYREVVEARHAADKARVLQELSESESEKAG